MGKLKDVLNRQWSWFEDNDFKGYDPFMGYSEHIGYIFRQIPLVGFQLSKIPEPLVRGNKTELAASHAHLIKGLINIANLRPKGTIDELVDRLLKLRSPYFEEYCWGYPFRFANNPPNQAYTIETIFAVESLLDYGKLYLDARLDAVIKSALNWIIKYAYCNGKLRYSVSGEYPHYPYNISAKGSALFAELVSITDENSGNYQTFSEELLAYVLSNRNDYFWEYSEKDKFVDVVHNCMIYSSLHRLSQMGLFDINRRELKQDFEQFLANLVIGRDMCLWDYAMLLEAIHKFDVTEYKGQIIEEILGLWSEDRGFFKFSHRTLWNQFGWKNRGYIRHNAMMFYALSEVVKDE